MWEIRQLRQYNKEWVIQLRSEGSCTDSTLMKQLARSLVPVATTRFSGINTHETALRDKERENIRCDLQISVHRALSRWNDLSQSLYYIVAKLLSI